MTASATNAASGEGPRPIAATVTPGDRRFRAVARAGAAATLVLTAGIATLLVIEAAPALRRVGLVDFLTTKSWAPGSQPPTFGIAAMLFGTAVTALVAMAVALPVSIGAAVFINEYAPPRSRRALIAVVDLMAAIPSIIFGLWARDLLLPRLRGAEGWLTSTLDFIPIFRADSIGGSLFETGIVVSLMVIPITTSVVREVLAQVPRGECEAALALGGTRWGMVRLVILPFGRGGMIGASMLGLGRALGETIAAALVLSFVYETSPRIFETGGVTIASVIAITFGEATDAGVQALMAAGLTLFVVTLAVNLAAAGIVARSRTGAGVEL